MAVSEPTASVVTLTHNRPERLIAAMRSVAAQTGLTVQHIVIGDEASYLDDPAFVARLRDEFPSAVVRNITRRADAENEYLPARLGRLRNLGISLAAGEFVAQLDDDNTFAPDHLISLVTLLRQAPHVNVAHSWRKLIGPDGLPFIPDGEDPWHPDPRRRGDSYRELQRLGVFTPGSNVVRDTLRVGDRVIGRVDTSEFLVRREFHRFRRFPETFSRARQLMEWTEDYAFGLDLARAGEPVLCSERATLNYHMGGYSNTHTAELTG